ncbi:SANT/Myb domain, partial [Dillenia turbinata]
MGQEEIRKGPWTEQEDLQLVCFVGLFGDRRWDFIAKVSGLNRAGKSCRLRWVNYLHPGLKRGKMTPHEERLVIELQSQWGNRWSRIARRLPGRTDNEIKNYWRTHMRKKAQERKRSMSPSPSNCSSSSSNNHPVDSQPVGDTGKDVFHDTGGPNSTALKGQKRIEEEEEKGCSMDQIWKDIPLLDEDIIQPINDVYPSIVSPMWEYSSDSLWCMNEEESKMPLPMC